MIFDALQLADMSISKRYIGESVLLTMANSVFRSAANSGSLT